MQGDLRPRKGASGKKGEPSLRMQEGLVADQIYLSKQCARVVGVVTWAVGQRRVLMEREMEREMERGDPLGREDISSLCITNNTKNGVNKHQNNTRQGKFPHEK